MALPRRSTRAAALAVGVLLLAQVLSTALSAARDEPPQSPPVRVEDARQWLTYLASDELQGRQVYTEGLGLAGAYIASQLRTAGVKPAGDGGTYFQSVRVLGVNTRSRSSVTVTVGGQSRTFADGQGVRFPRNQGGRQAVTATAVFAGYGLTVPELSHDDYRERNSATRIVLFMGNGPQGMTPVQNRLLAGRGRNAIEIQRAAAAIGFLQPAAAQPRREPATAPAAAAGDAPATPAATPAATTPGTSPAATPPAATPPAATPAATAAPNPNRGEFQTVQRLDTLVPPSITAGEEFFTFVFSAASHSYSDLKALADRREPLPPVSLDGVSITVDVNADYDIVQTRLTRNVIGMVEGSDGRLKDTFVMLGAHYDHVGYQQVPPAPGAGANLIASCSGQQRPQPRTGDIIYNGADDDASGSVALLGIARRLAAGPRPKRSLLFVWHAGEEAGLLGSRYYADYPGVPLDKIAAQLNVDMIGRNRCDDPAEANTVYLVGSDRISTELHNLSEDANAALDRPLTLDYEMNDPADPESLYTRSDHYSYAAKGIPVIFYTTGLHRDYHYVTDEVDKIDFVKLTRIAQLVYTTAFRLGNLDHFPSRDNRGPRTGKERGGKLGL